MFKSIFIDLDGVLVDLEKGFCDLFIKLGYIDKHVRSKTELTDTEKDFNVSSDRFWEIIDNQGAAFWENLETYPWTNYLWETCNKLCENVLVVTTPSHNPECSTGKLRWMNKYLGNGKTFRNYALCPKKGLLANSKTILIDDRVAVCDDFEAHGGRTILFPQLYNLSSPLKEGETLEQLQYAVADKLHQYKFIFSKNEHKS